MSTRTHRRRVALALVALALGAGPSLAGCSGSGGGASSPPPAGSATAGGQATAPVLPTPGSDPTAPEPTAPEPTAPAGPLPPAPAGPTGAAPTTTTGGPAPVPTAAVTTLPPVAAGEEASLSDDVVVRVVGVEEQDVVAVAPGDTSGRAALVTLVARNDGTTPADLAGVAVTASVAGAPASPLTVDGASLLTGTLAPGGRTRATYAFGLGTQDAAELVLEVSSGTSSAAVRLLP